MHLLAIRLTLTLTFMVDDVLCLCTNETAVEERLSFEIPAMIRFYSVRPAQISPQARSVAPHCPIAVGQLLTPCTRLRFDALTHCLHCLEDGIG